MKSVFVAGLLLSVSSAAALAQDVTITSKVERVTVYPNGADVARLGKADLAAGDDSVIFSGLPANVDPQSIRVVATGGKGLEIGSIDTKLVADGGAQTDSERHALELQVEGLGDARAAQDQIIADQEMQRKLLLTLADKARVQTAGTATNAIGVAGLDGMLGTVATRLAATSKAIQDAKIQQRQIDKDIAALQLKMQNLAPEGVQKLQAVVHVHAGSTGASEFTLSYRVPDAGWNAFYDAKLNLPKAGEAAQIALIRRADVWQQTGEDWQDVALTLSTAEPSGAASVPELTEQELHLNLPVALGSAQPASPALRELAAKNELKKDKGALQDGEDARADAPEAEPAKQAEEQRAQVMQAGFDANYLIDGRVSIDRNGTAKKVNIGESQFAAKLGVESVPRLDANAYLMASFTTSADAPLLAGPVYLFRDGSYVGQSQMREFASGEEARLGFGVDELVKIKRAEVKRLAAQEGLLTTSDTQEMAWTISVTNLHDMKMPVRIVDRKPFSSDAKISVSDVTGATPASVTDLDSKRGVLAWDLALDAKGKAEIKTGYKITAPKDMHVSLVD